MLTKGQTLANLRGKLLTARIADIVIIQHRKWKTSPNEVLETISERLCSSSYIVRSSCRDEDNTEHSSAGKYTSLLNVSAQDIYSAVNQVFASYEYISDDSEVFVQPMLTDVIHSGVIFTHDPKNGSPYRLINWYDGLDTTAVTAGKSCRMWQHAAYSTHKTTPIGVEVLLLIDELQTHFSFPLDVEFAITCNPHNQTRTLWLLQVRPLILSKPPLSPEEQYSLLAALEHRLERDMSPHPFLKGSRTVYGVMPDWNPAEIIGTHPKPLSTSLYRELVTDSIWAYQRDNYGYQNLRSFPLLVCLEGLPYIDVRVSFNSFIPKSLDAELSSRLVDFYLDKLVSNPDKHDKVEFDIVFSCYTFNLTEQLEELLPYGFTTNDLQNVSDSLKKLTNNIIKPDSELLTLDHNRVSQLEQRRALIASSNLSLTEKIYWLLEDCKRYGTLPFAGLARAGFIAVQLLSSLVQIGVLTRTDYSKFLSSISTITSQLGRDQFELAPADFLNSYGHLRPGTYDILSPRYDAQPDLYFDFDNIKAGRNSEEHSFSLTLEQIYALSDLLQEHSLSASPVQFLKFIQTAIEWREYSKFEFTKNLSMAIELFAELGSQYSFSRNQLAYSDISIIKEVLISGQDIETLLHRSIEKGKALYNRSSLISLPPLITEPQTIWSYEWPKTKPTYVTMSSVTGPIVHRLDRTSVLNKIVCIHNADPGYDWLFSCSIKGLVTMWGGANSHMAIRCSELNIPAVIGCGDLLYSSLVSAQIIRIDCATQRIDILS